MYLSDCWIYKVGQWVKLFAEVKVEVQFIFCTEHDDRKVEHFGGWKGHEKNVTATTL